MGNSPLSAIHHVVVFQIRNKEEKKERITCSGKKMIRKKSIR